MNSYSVAQQISFCYGHRLKDYQGKCAHLHGHNAVAEFTFQSNKLNSQGMVIDFLKIKTIMKKWIDETIDHRMLLQKNDPLVTVLKEKDEPIVSMDNPPTAENIAELLFQKAHELELPIVEVKLWETPTQYAVFKR